MTTLSKESFKLSVNESYEIDGKVLTVIDKVSNYGTGKLTVYTVEIDGTTYENKPIGFYKKMFGATVNHRDTTTVTGNSKKVLTDAEITDKVDNYKSKFDNIVERVNELIKLSNTDDTFTYDFNAYVTAYRDNLIAVNEERKRENERIENERRERETRKADKETVKKVMDNGLSDIQRAIMAAMLAGDFAKVAELSAQVAAQ